jgi:hypothetical protein
MIDKYQYAEGDINSDAKGSGARANKGKISLSLIPFHLLGGLSRVFMGGKLKYAEFNWAKGMPWNTCMDCTLRHLLKWWFMGEDIDEESGEHHLSHVLANILMLIHYTKAYPEGDNRPKDYTMFTDWLDDFSLPFDEDAYLERNPEIAEIVAKREADEAQKTS